MGLCTEWSSCLGESEKRKEMRSSVPVGTSLDYLNDNPPDCSTRLPIGTLSGVEFAQIMQAHAYNHRFTGISLSMLALGEDRFLVARKNSSHLRLPDLLFLIAL